MNTKDRIMTAHTAGKLHTVCTVIGRNKRRHYTVQDSVGNVMWSGVAASAADARSKALTAAPFSEDCAAALRAQRDDLAAALRDVHTTLTHANDNYDRSRILEVARAALAKVTP